MSNGQTDIANAARQERTDILHRKNVDLLSPDELAAFGQAFEEIKEISKQARGDDRGFFAHAGVHGVPDWDCPHHTPDRQFLPWHRAYLYRLEQALQDRNPSVTLPWWDWTATRGVPAAYGEGTLLSSETLVTAADQRRGQPVVDETFRDPGPPGSLPTADEVESLLREPNFVTFSDALEEIHDGVHGWIGGTMGNVSYAAFDPIFWAHHCMIDRIWWLWQQEGRAIAGPAADPNWPQTVLEPFNMAIADTFNANSLGYDYAATETLLEPANPSSGGPLVTNPVPAGEVVKGDFQRADLEVGGIDHGGPSFEGRIFLNNPDASAETDKSDASFVGSFNVFGHGGCFGAEGHCDVPDERRRFDKRPLPRLIRMKKRINVTEALKGAAQGGGDLQVTIVPVPVQGAPGEEPDPNTLLDQRRISIVTYQ